MDVTRLLIVDDDPLVRSALTFMLGGQPDLEVVGEAGDGGEGVARAEELRPDVVLMDIRMPRLNGLDGLRERVSLLHGTLTACHRPAGGFLLDVSLPLTR